MTSLHATAAAIGNFDGVHLGHRLLLDYLTVEAASRGLAPIAITFAPHPLGVIAPDRAPLLLQSGDDRMEMLGSLGVTPLLLPFTRELCSLTAREFMEVMSRRYNVRLLVIGHDNRFGSDSPAGVSHSELMVRYVEAGRHAGIEVIEAPRLPDISSSAIRGRLSQGDVAGAREMLGHPFEWSGKVMHGKEIGRTIGFPTANLESLVGGLILPQPGVYACMAEVDGATYPAMLNIGVRPTVDGAGAPQTVEAHLYGLDHDIYGHTVKLRFLDYLRAEQRFPSLDALRRQLARDLKATLAACRKFISQ